MTDLGSVDERTTASIAAYDTHAAAYQQALRLRRPVADVRRFAEMLRRGDLVLDVGCGPATDLRLLRDIGAHPVGVDLSFGALQVARMLLPYHPLVQAPIDRLPFRTGVFGGLWISGGFNHLPRRSWSATFGYLLTFVGQGPVYLACRRGQHDLAEVDDPVLGAIYESGALEDEIDALMRSHGLVDVSVEVRPDPIHDRRRPGVVGLGRVVTSGRAPRE